MAAEEIVGLSSHGLQVTENSKVLMDRLIPDIEKTIGLIQEIVSSTLEQNSGADQINSAIQQLNMVAQGSASSSEEIASSSEELTGQAESLREAIAYFKVDSEAFMHHSGNHKTNKAKYHQQANSKEELQPVF